MYEAKYSTMYFIFQIYCHITFLTTLILDPDSDKVRRETEIYI